MFEEIKEYFNTVTELKAIHHEIKKNTIEAYDTFLEALITVYDLWKNGADENYRNEYPVAVSKTIEKANPNDFQSTVVKNLINEKPADETLRYKYIYVNRYKNDPAVIVDLELLRELFVKDDFKFTIKYEKDSIEDFYDTISISMYYKDLKAFLDEKEQIK